MDPNVLDDEFKVENSVYPKAALVSRSGKGPDANEGHLL